MAHEKRSVQHIKTMGGLVDGRRSRTSAGALLELSMLEMEKQRLGNELQRAKQRSIEIQGRLTEIETKQLRLYRFVEMLPEGAQVPQAHSVATPLPIYSMPTGKLKSKKLSY